MTQDGAARVRGRSRIPTIACVCTDTQAMVAARVRGRGRIPTIACVCTDTQAMVDIRPRTHAVPS